MDNLIYTQILSSTSDYIDQNDSDYSAKSNPDYKRQQTVDKLKSNIENINWEAESQYHNTYYLGKGKYGYRQLKSKKNA